MSEVVVNATGDCLVGDDRAEMIEAALSAADRVTELAARLGELAGMPGASLVLTADESDAVHLAAELSVSNTDLVISDQRLTALGRGGAWFDAASADVIILGSSLTSAYVPAGALLVSAECESQLPASSGSAASTAALLNLDIIEREGLVAQAGLQELTLAAALVCVRGHSLVSSVRTGPGLIAVIDVAVAVQERLVDGLAERGVLVRLTEAGVVMAPPLTIDRAGLQRIGAALDQCLASLGSRSSGSSTADVTLLPDITGDESGGFGDRDAELLRDVPPHHGI